MAETTAITEARIAKIAAMMRNLEWRRGETGRTLEVEWNLSTSRIEHLAAEASRRVRAEVLDPDQVSETVACALDRIMRDAIKDDDRKNAIAAGKVWAVIAGAVAPKKIEHSGSVATTSYDDLQRRLAATTAGDSAGTDANPVAGDEPVGPEDD